MVIIRFPSEASQEKALGFLIGKCSGHSWATGEMLVPEEALPLLAQAGFTFTVEGRATDERVRSLRDTPSVAV
jgi:hypothetical protein